VRGLVYALTELADRVRYGDAVLSDTQFPLVESPTAKIRSICRAFASEREDKAWFHDRSHWSAYLDMLVSNRFNRFALALGMGYDYPYHNHIVSDGLPALPLPLSRGGSGHHDHGRRTSGRRARHQTSTCCASSGGRQRGAASTSSSRCGRNVNDFDDAPNANYTVIGVTEANFAPYCRDAIALLLREVPANYRPYLPHSRSRRNFGRRL